VAQGSAPDGFLTRTLKNAEIIRVPGGLVPAREALAEARADVYGENIHLAYRIAADLPGATVLDGRFNVVQMSIAVPKSKAAALPTVNDFIPPQPRGWDRCDGYVRRADNLVSPALWIADHGVRPATYFCGLASQRIRTQNGSQIRSRKHAGGNRLPAISFVTGTGLMVRSLSVDFDRWAFATDHHRRAPLGKMDMLKG
jgi:hypothetical protein